ncbi:Rieske (2Fe-2S) protein [Halorarius halobius]|uniref:Rieske (2Fe-2S) protein n=1 Tax=Halorarius halobius TaxID=2962671 RepID=UPI0020CCE0B6|nr:Rieske 2Fe-2S domain-containing protein [Halorarius halobius]
MERIATVEDVPDHGSYLFTVTEPSGRKEEVILVHAADGIAAWKNFCMHEPDQRLDTGLEGGAAMRSGEIICPRHGSMFDAETGYCDNGDAKGQTLVEVDVTVRHGDVFLTDDAVEFAHDGGIDDDDGMPDSTSHIGF